MSKETEYGWLIEKGETPNIAYVFVEEFYIENDRCFGSKIGWTPDPFKALRFATIISTNSFSLHLKNEALIPNLLELKSVEHGFDGEINYSLQSDLKASREREKAAVELIRDAKDCLIDGNWADIAKRHLIARLHEALTPKGEK